MKRLLPVTLIGLVLVFACKTAEADPRRKKPVISSVIVPSLEPTKPAQPQKPKFGYGSDYGKATTSQTAKKPVVQRPQAVVTQPQYTLQHNYQPRYYVQPVPVYSYPTYSGYGTYGRGYPQSYQGYPHPYAASPGGYIYSRPRVTGVYHGSKVSVGFSF